ncbi:MAG: sigma 54-interacting transcriptional regulator [Desulfatirhabdiaceae bacterium]
MASRKKEKAAETPHGAKTIGAESAPSPTPRGDPVGQDMRRQAEEIALKTAALSPENIDSLSSEELRQILHELRVHQIELEMQNEELRQADADLEASRARYFDLYDMAPVGYCTISEKGLILEANFTASNLFGNIRNELIKQPISRFIFSDDQDVYYLYRKRLFETGMLQKCEVRIVKKDGTVFWASMASTVEQDSAGTPLSRLVISDITDHKRIEKIQIFLAQTSSGPSDEPFFNALARFLAESLEMEFVCINRLDDKGLTARTVTVWKDGHFEDNVTYNLKGTPFEDMVGQTVCYFPANVCKFFPCDQMLQNMRAESYLGVTIWGHTGQPIGLISVFGKKPLVNRRLAESTLKLVAIRAAGEFERMEVEDALQQAHDELEKQVEARTADLFVAMEEAEKRKEIAEYSLIEIKKLKEQLEAERAYLQEEIQLQNNHEQIIGQSDGLKYVLYKVDQIAGSDTTVLVLGETGTGKELVARAIHSLSSRKNRAMVKVNCAALPANLIESELFGREKGAFTGSDSRQLGRFEIAHGTTLFLDEIGELPLELQPKLLRVLQDGEFERLGGSRTIKVDVRIVAATNRNLEIAVQNGHFREDLWYRLNVFPITMPPLRDRLEDIPLLVDFYVNKISKRMGKTIEIIPVNVMKALQDYQWPGNVRELENVLERAVINSSGPKLHLADELKKPAKHLISSPKTMESVERDHILQILQQTQWKVGGKNSAAEILGLDRSTLRARMRKLDIRKP